MARGRSNRRRYKPRVEALEAYTLLSTFVVINNNDGGPGSLRAAIEGVDADPNSTGSDEIEFDLASPYNTIQPLSALPPITHDNVTIAGDVTLDGSRCGPCNGLVFESNHDYLGGSMTITHFEWAGVVLTGNYDSIVDVLITVNGEDGVYIPGSNSFLSGDEITDNGYNGVDISGNDNTIGWTTPGVGIPFGGNWISGNANDGVNIISGGSGNVLLNNFIGTDIWGTSADSNAWSGVAIYNAPGNLIGGTIQGAGNVISGNGNNGIWVAGSGSTNEVIQGNKVGTDFSGRYALGNAWSGISVDLDGPTGPASEVLIGGSVPQAGNIVAASGNAGVYIAGAGVTGVTVEGNHIGTDITGEVALGNAWGGVLIGQGASGETLSGNLISGNTGANGVTITDAGTSGNLVAGNLIGTDATGTQPLGNGQDGVIIANGATDNTVSGTTLSARNIISANGWDGVAIIDPGTSGNLVVGNFIGTDATGTQPLGNCDGGVNVTNGAADNTVGGTTVGARNILSANGWDGVGVGDGTSGNIVQGNFIGTDVSGTLPLGNGNRGIGLYNASGNLIGGTAPGAGNTIADNVWEGIAIYDSSNNLVEGNRIGTDVTGLKAIGNDLNGIGIWGGSTGNTIGGPAAGAGNLISGNGLNYGGGIAISDPGTSGNVMQGNLIGTDATGRSPLGNLGDGIGITGGASNNTIGGPDPGDGNVVSANGATGIDLSWSTSGNTVQGNRIGTDTSGTLPLGNTAGGVVIWSQASGNLIGGPEPGDSNVISANGGDGVAISDSGTTDNLVQWNFIGTDITGTRPLGNAGNGVAIHGGASFNFIGLPSPGVGNVISANFLTGVSIADAGTTDNVVSHNLIGTNLTGTSALGNFQGGVAIFNGASENLIGTTDETGGNIISGNGFGGASGSYSGVVIAGDQTDDNLVQHNIIGLAAGGESALPNAQDGVDIFGGADANVIGGSQQHTENLISGNVGAGIMISDFTTNRNVILGDLVGTDLTGNTAIPNGSDGIQLVNTHSNTVGGGTTAASRNIIAGNIGSGVVLIASQANTIAGNSIGVGLGGSALGNLAIGVYLEEASSFNVIGGTDPSSVNLICANGLAGVLIDGTGSDDNVVQGNLIGTDGVGTAGIGNAYEGVLVSDGASNNTIGGASAAARNVISGNGFSSGLSYPGVEFYGAGTSGNLLEGNFIGTDPTGSRAVGNFSSGIAVEAGAADNTIGGTAPGAGNLISGNGNPAALVTGTGFGSGVDIFGINGSVTGTVVAGNLIGTDITGTKPLGNLLDGVHLQDAASDNTIGGTAAGAGNVIAFNGGNGVTVGVGVTDNCTGDAILGNSISSNALLGIDLAGDGVTPNDSQGHAGPNLFQDFPVITSATTIGSTTTITGTITGPANSTLRVELFSNPAADPSGFGQGQVFLGYVTVTTGVGGSGAFAFTTTTPIPVGQVVTATATDAEGNTSEFSQDMPVAASAPLHIGSRFIGPLYNPIKHTYTEIVVLTNDGTSTVDGFEFVLEQLTPGVTLTGASGTTADGSPYILVGRLRPHQSIALTLTFTKALSSLFINYTPEFVPIS
jgi:parallel beta-helix repeat protein